jgi:hypothetical protein
VSKMTERGGMLAGLPDGPAGTGNGTVDALRRGLGVFGRQREATILVVTVALLRYFGLPDPLCHPVLGERGADRDHRRR